MSALDEAIGTTQSYLLETQSAQGYWVGELESDVTVSAGYIPLMRFLGLAFPERERKIADFLKRRLLQSAPWAAWVRTANEPVYAPEHLSERRVFTSVLTVTYRALK